MTADNQQFTVLVVDDEKNIRESIKLALSHEGWHVVTAHDTALAMRTLHQTIVDAMVLDIRLGEVDGIAFFKTLQAEGIDVPTVFISGQATLTEAAQAVRVGGFDFIEKPFSASKIAITMRRCLEHASLTKRVRLMEGAMHHTGIIGDSRLMRELVADLFKIAGTQANVMIQGESGTGKELIAATIHANSSRSEMPMVKVNCSAIPEALIESELFGCEKGAFSGALSARKGLFESAHRGVIFLDEVADLSLAAQAKILRALQNGEVQKLGGERAIKVDVRVFAATHKDLKQCVADGSFREDLYYRLNVVPVRVPSLRERPDDIPLLAAFLTKALCDKNNLKAKQLDSDVLHSLKVYSWPGNVRELQNVLERMLIMSGDTVTLEDLPDELVVNAKATNSGARSSLGVFRDNAEREFILAALKRHHGNITRAATDLGVGRTYLHRRLLILGIEKKEMY